MMEVTLKPEFYEKIRLMIREEMKNVTIEVTVKNEGYSVEQASDIIKEKLLESFNALS